MQLIKYYFVGKDEPSDDDLKECIEMMEAENCVIYLVTRFDCFGCPKGLLIRNKKTFDELKEGVKRFWAMQGD